MEYSGDECSRDKVEGPSCTEAASSLASRRFTQSSSFLGLPDRILNMNPKKNYFGAYG